MSRSDFTVEELQAMLADKQAAERKEKESRQRTYERKREQLINSLGYDALRLNTALTQFKQAAFDKLQAFRELLLEYGDLRRGDKNKGSFTIKNERYKIEVSTQVIKSFDERSEAAEAKLHIFLQTLVKKKDLAAYELVNAAIQRNEKTGSFDPDVVNRLYKIEDKFDDPNWKAALEMFKQSYSPTGTALYVRFYRMTPTGAWKSVPLDFAALEVEKEVSNEN